jgi:hypothetical protein
LHNAKQKAFIAALFLAVWFVTVRCPTSVAQDAIGHLPTAGGDFAYQPPVAPVGEYADDTTWDSPGAKAANLTWTQRVARVARGRTQLEGGYSYLRGSAGGSDWTQHAIPDMLLRFGLTDRLELRLGWPGYVSSDSDDPAVGSGFTGTLDPNVGLLYDLWGQRGLLPQTAVLAAVPIPLEGNPFALNSLQPLTEVMYSWQTSDRTAITGRSGFAIFDAAGDNYTQFQQSLSLDVILTERLGAFVSWDMLADHGSWNDTSQHMGGGGLSFLLTERLAISWRSAVGLNSAAPDFLNDIRFAYRF